MKYDFKTHRFCQRQKSLSTKGISCEKKIGYDVEEKRNNTGGASSEKRIVDKGSRAISARITRWILRGQYFARFRMQNVLPFVFDRGRTRGPRFGDNGGGETRSERENTRYSTLLVIGAISHTQICTRAPLRGLNKFQFGVNIDTPPTEFSSPVFLRNDA